MTNINEETIIRLATRQYKRVESVPGVAGYIHNETPTDVEYKKIIAIANKAKMAVERDNSKVDVEPLPQRLGIEETIKSNESDERATNLEDKQAEKHSETKQKTF